MTWLVSYRSVEGRVVEVRHDTREQARDALTDQLIDSAMVLWRIANSYGPTPFGPLINRQREFYDRGDQLIGHVLELIESTEGEYVIVGAQGRQWLLCALPERAEVAR